MLRWQRTRARYVMAALAGALAVGGSGVVGTGAAQAAHIVSVTEVSPQLSEVAVFSPAMGKVIRNQVLHLPGKPSAPTFYMLPGLGGAEDGISWMNNGGAPRFFANKRVNAVFPIGGRSSMFTDWQHDDPALGRNKWTTYLTRELPPVIDREFRTTGANAISGVSMSAGPALALAEAAPSRYRAVAAYSGCPGTTDPHGLAATTAVVGRSGGNVLNMWGPPGSPAWVANDPVVNAGKLRGKAVFLSAASGVPGRVDGGLRESFGGLLGGGQIESYAHTCTVNMSNRLNQLGIGHQFSNRPVGSHSWGLFNADLRASWPLIARAIGA